MKNRILSCVLAVLMVVSMLTVLAVNASAEATGVTLTVGTTYAVPGTTAYVDVYVSATALPEEYVGLRNWQVVFAGAPVAAKGEFVFDVTGADPSAFVNENGTVGCSSDTSKDGNVYEVALSETILARGGAKIVTAAFNVPSDATGEIEISVTDATLKFEDDTFALYEEAATLVAGKIILVDSVSEFTAPYEGTGEDYVVPGFDANGNVINDLLIVNDDDVALAGSFGLLTIPASITENIADGLSACEFGALVIKNADLDNLSFALGTSAAPTTVYFHKRANGTGATAAYFDGLSNLNKKKVNAVNLLATTTEAQVNGNNVTFTGVITAEDLDYDTVTLVADFGEKVKEVEFKSVCKTVKGVATVDEAVATAQGVELVDGAYLASMTVTGVPAGTYTVNVTMYGTTPDANGNLIWVCSDTTPIEVTVA